MYPIAEPFLSSEIDYRQEQVRRQFHAHPRRHRHQVPRRHTLGLPRPRRRPLALA